VKSGKREAALNKVSDYLTVIQRSLLPVQYEGMTLVKAGSHTSCRVASHGWATNDNQYSTPRHFSAHGCLASALLLAVQYFNSQTNRCAYSGSSTTTYMWMVIVGMPSATTGSLANRAICGCRWIIRAQQPPLTGLAAAVNTSTALWSSVANLIRSRSSANTLGGAAKGFKPLCGSGGSCVGFVAMCSNTLKSTI